MLAIPGAITILLLLFTRMKFPNPERFEPEPKEYVPFQMKKEFVLYIAGISLFAFGFIDYSIIIMHVSRTYTQLAAGLAETTSLVSSGSLPLLYAGAMLVDAVAALVFGMIYDKKGVRALVWSTLLSAPFAIFVFRADSVPMLLLGMRLGEGSGCPLAFEVLDAACAIINDMATFDEAGIDDGYLDEIREGDKFTVEDAQ